MLSEKMSRTKDISSSVKNMNPVGMNDEESLTLCRLWEKHLLLPVAKKPHELWEDHKIIVEEMSKATKSLDKFERPDRFQCIDAFLEWAEKIGVQHDHVKIGFNNGLSLCAKSDVPANTVVVTVPRKAILSTEYAEQCQTLKRILVNDDMTKSMSNVALAITLGHELLRGDESPWKPYLDILPEPSTPLSFTLEEFEKLKGSPLFEDALFFYRSVARQYAYFYLQIHGTRTYNVRKRLMKLAKVDKPSYIFDRSPFTPKNFTFELYKWCVGIVSTRINVIPQRDESQMDEKLTSSLVPFIDLANHNVKMNGAGSMYYEAETETVNLGTGAALSAGDEICLFYGRRYSSMFLLHNGFVPSCVNLEDGYCLRIGMPVKEENVFKSEYLDKLKIMNRTITTQSFIYTFYLKEADRDEVIENVKSTVETDNFEVAGNALTEDEAESFEGLWRYALAFQAKNEAELNDYSHTDLRQRALKYLLDRLKILIIGHRITGENPHEPKREDETLNMYHIRKLMIFEKELLQKYYDAMEGVNFAPDSISEQ